VTRSLLSRSRDRRPGRRTAYTRLSVTSVRSVVRCPAPRGLYVRQTFAKYGIMHMAKVNLGKPRSRCLAPRTRE
jgi:hypothetical protein